MGFQFLLLILVVPFITGDPCDDGQYAVIRDNRRSSQYVPGPDEDKLCDDGVINSGEWYKFEDELTGTSLTLVENCVDQGHCGTFAPMWLDGSHPSVNDTDIDAEVCATLSSCTDPDPCSQRLAIKIRWCSADDSYRYRLEPPQGCAIAYCAGDTPQCGDGMVWDPTVDRCIEAAPVLNGKPIILPPVVDENFKEFWMACDIPLGNANHTNRTPVVESVFLFNEKPDYRTKTVTVGEQTRTYLYSSDFLGHLGKVVACQVNVSWENSTYFPRPVVSENGYYAGVKFYQNINGTLTELTSPIEIAESDQVPKEIFPVSTVPILASDNMDYLHITVVQNSQHGTVASNCETYIWYYHWNNDTSEAFDKNSSFLVTAFRDSQYQNGGNTFAIDFEMAPFLSPDDCPSCLNTFWHGYNMPSVQVHSTDSEGGECQIVTDPHITTFDQIKFNNFEIGDFYYVISGSVRNFQVQVRQYLCNLHRDPSVSCACAVAVQEGNTVLGVDACDLMDGSASRPYFIQYSDVVEHGAGIYGDETHFAICMGSGLCVRIHVDEISLSIYIDGTAEDKDNVRGLCGNFNGNSGDDFEGPDGQPSSCDSDSHGCPDYNNLWRVAPEDSLFESVPPHVNTNYTIPELCNCIKNGDEQVVTCDLEKKLNLGTASSDVQPLTHTSDVKSRRRRRSAGYSSIGERSRVNYDFTWPTSSGITEEEATELCVQAIYSSPAFDTCYELFNKTLFDGVSDCVTDINALDDDKFPTKSIISDMEEVCIGKVNRMEVNENTTGTEFDPSFILQEVQRFVCPSQCSGNGTCVNGTCICNPGSIGSDCSIAEGEPPELKEIEFDGICDIRKKTCTVVSLTASNVVASDKLTCRITHKPLPQGETVNTTGRVRSKWEMICPIPETPVSLNSSMVEPGASVYGFMVSVSNDGQSYSPSLELTVYDSVCYFCEAAGNCTRKSGNCVIGGHCLDNEEVNPLNQCEQCRSETSDDSWSANEDNQPPSYTGETTLLKLEGFSLTIQLSAEDPENADEPVQFFLDSPVDGVTVSPSGLLEWSSDHNKNVAINLVLTDICGKSAQQEILLELVTCPCENKGTCVPKPNSPSGSGEFICQCPEGTTGELCEILTGWSPWSEWSECSRTCDYGLQTRHRECYDTCAGLKTEVQVCIVTDCTDSADQAVTLVLNETISTFLMEKMDELKILLSEVVNTECETATGQCCAMANLNPKNEADQGDFKITTDDLVQIQRLFENPDGLELTILVGIDESLAENSCESTKRIRRNANQFFIDESFLINSIQNNKEYIEQTLGIHILDLEEVAQEEGPDQSDDTGLIVGLAVGGVMLIALVSVMIVWKVKFRPNAVTPRPEQRQDGKEEETNEFDLPQPQSNKP